MKNPIVIVGAGLSGLHVASQLISQGYECRVLEARDRIGGRVLSKMVLNKPEIGTFDLGPTWFWPQHESVITNLVKKLGLRTMDQYIKGSLLFEQSQQVPIQRHVLPEGAVHRSVRLSGGVMSLINAVAASLPSGTVELGTTVTSINMDEEGTITVEADLAHGNKKRIRAGAVILALPPRIVANRIVFSPALPLNLVRSLENKPTWMAGQAKVVAIYNYPFWREDGLSGQAMSWAGPLQEIHDASPETGYGALFGFFGLSAKKRQELNEGRVLNLVVDQLTRLYGSSAEKPISLLYKDWFSDPETAVDDDLNPLSDFPNYGLPSNNVWGKKIIFAGTETSPEFGGHLEGALRSAERAVLTFLS